MESNLLREQHKSELSRPDLNTKRSKVGYFNGELLKPFEESSQRKGLLGSCDFENFYPLWFHYENERNITLWSLGVSLSDRDNYQIWINPFTLIEKHRARRIDSTNPLSSPQALSHTPNGRELTAEAGEYYALLKALFERSLPHLHALSVAQQSVIPELAGKDIFVN